LNKNEWQVDAVKLANTGVMSWREISKYLDVPRSTVSDFLRKYAKVMDDTEAEEKPSVHLYIPDNQVKDGISFDYLSWIGRYIIRKRPDVIISGGDFADMPSLSIYDKGKRTAEGKRVQKDIDAAVRGMEILLAPLRELQRQQREVGEPIYNPRMVLTLGNHEDRINRHVDANPELHGFLSIDSLKYKEFGWEVIPFLTPIMINGVAYCHYFPNVMTGKPLSGTAANMLKTIGTSFTQGHKQTLDVTTRFLPTDGAQQWGIIAGACYLHDEDYKGVMGNKHWRGLVVKHNVRNGSYDPLFISLDWLEKEYGNK
jgi:hypothetical protein